MSSRVDVEMMTNIVRQCNCKMIFPFCGSDLICFEFTLEGFMGNMAARLKAGFILPHRNIL